MTKVAIIRRNGLGDLLCTYPLVLYFRKYFPKTELTLFADERNAPLLPYLPQLDETVIFPSGGNKYLHAIQTALRYRRHNYDMAISAKSSPMKLINIFLYALGAKQRVASVGKGWHRHLINCPIPYDEKAAKKAHQAVKNLQAVEPKYTAVPEEFFPKISVPKTLPQPTLPLEGPILLLSATTTRPTSRFDPFRYAEIVNRAHRDVPFNVLLIGQKKDEARARAIQEGLRVPHLLYFPRSFAEFMVLLDRSDFYFVGDGGIAHIGAALDKPQVVLFGETNPAEWAPMSRLARTFYDPLHVNRLSDEVLQKAITEVICGRNDL